MDLIVLVIILSVVACVVYLITTRLPMDATLRIAIQLLAFIVLLLYVLRRFAVLPNVM